MSGADLLAIGERIAKADMERARRDDCWKYEGRWLSEMLPTELAHVIKLVEEGRMFVSCGRPYRSTVTP